MKWCVKVLKLKDHNMAIKLITKAIPQHNFDTLEIHPCRMIEHSKFDSFVEQCEPSEAEFWSVYIHYNPESNMQEIGGLECIADCDTETEAEDLKIFLTAFAQKAE